MRIESFYYFILGFLEVVQRYVISALNNRTPFRPRFSMLIGEYGRHHFPKRRYGRRGPGFHFAYAQSPKSAQFITWLLGVAIF